MLLLHFSSAFKFVTDQECGKNHPSLINTVELVVMWGYFKDWGNTYFDIPDSLEMDSFHPAIYT